MNRYLFRHVSHPEFLCGFTVKIEWLLVGLMVHYAVSSSLLGEVNLKRILRSLGPCPVRRHYVEWPFNMHVTLHGGVYLARLCALTCKQNGRLV